PRLGEPRVGAVDLPLRQRPAPPGRAVPARHPPGSRGPTGPPRPAWRAGEAAEGEDHVRVRPGAGGRLGGGAVGDALGVGAKMLTDGEPTVPARPRRPPLRPAAPPPP